MASTISVSPSNSRRLALNLGLVALLSVYYTFYFLPFDGFALQGSHVSFEVVKIVSMALIIFGLFPIHLSGLESRKYSTLLALYGGYYCICIAIYLHAILIKHDDANFIYVNQIVFLPIALILYQVRSRDILVEIFKSIAIIVTIEVIVCFVLYFYNIFLYQTIAFVGGVGNPSSFGVAAIMALSYVWCFSRRSSVLWLSATILIFGCLLTQSLFATCALFASAPLLYVFERDFLKLLYRALHVAAVFIFCIYFSLLPHLLRKLEGLSELIMNNNISQSVPSIGGRVDQFGAYIDSLKGGSESQSKTKSQSLPVSVTESKSSYMPADSQYITIALNFGYVMAIIFAIINIILIIMAINVEKYFRPFILTVVIVFNANLFVNHLLDYFPMMFFYVLIIASILRFQRPPTTATSAPPTATPIGLS